MRRCGCVAGRTNRTGNETDGECRDRRDDQCEPDLRHQCGELTASCRGNFPLERISRPLMHQLPPIQHQPPGEPYGSNFDVFIGTIANGTWSLYVFDDGNGDSGVISGGWTLNITTANNTISDIPDQATLPTLQRERFPLSLLTQIHRSAA